jgi:hypothetical protein
VLPPPDIAKKFAAYIAIAEQGIHRSHFGFPNFFVPFIATTTACMNSMGQRSLATSNSGRLANRSNEDRYGAKRSRYGAKRSRRKDYTRDDGRRNCGTAVRICRIIRLSARQTRGSGREAPAPGFATAGHARAQDRQQCEALRAGVFPSPARQSRRGCSSRRWQYSCCLG